MSRGLCTPEQIASCPLKKHYSDSHHLYFYASDYKSPVESAFRNLEQNKVQLCRYEHNELHANQAPPEKPDRLRMLAILAFNEVDIAI